MADAGDRHTVPGSGARDVLNNAQGNACCKEHQCHCTSVYVTVDQSANTGLLFLREKFRRENDSAKRAGLGRNGGLCFIQIIPDLDRDETNQQRKKNPSGGNMPGETALKACAHSVSASLDTTKYTPPAMKLSDHEGNQGHP